MTLALPDKVLPVAGEQELKTPRSLAARRMFANNALSRIAWRFNGTDGDVLDPLVAQPV